MILFIGGGNKPKRTCSVVTERLFDNILDK